MQTLKNHLGGQGSQDEIQYVTKESKNIANIWNNFTEEDWGEDADLSNFRNEWNL